MTGIIYKITNIVNNKVYIGKTLETMEKRWKEHQKDSSRFTDRPLYRAMNKYGLENFTIEIIDEPNIDLLSERESYWIEYYKSYHHGYNATLGGDGRVLYDYQQIGRGIIGYFQMAHRQKAMRHFIYTQAGA